MRKVVNFCLFENTLKTQLLYRSSDNNINGTKTKLNYSENLYYINLFQFQLAWSTIATAKNVTQLVIGRFIIGLGTGLHFVTGVVYIGEISQASIRGALLTIMSFMYNLGTLASYTEGWFCSYEVINYLNLTTAVTFILLAMCLKETPVYLLRIGKEKVSFCTIVFKIIDEKRKLINKYVYYQIPPN